MNDAAPLSEIRVEEIRARLDAVGDPSFIHQGPAMCFTLDAQQAALFVLAHNAPADIRVLLADRDRLQRRVEELEATMKNAIEHRNAPHDARYDACQHPNCILQRALTSETPQ